MDMPVFAFRREATYEIPFGIIVGEELVRMPLDLIRLTLQKLGDFNGQGLLLPDRETIEREPIKLAGLYQSPQLLGWDVDT